MITPDLPAALPLLAMLLAAALAGLARGFSGFGSALIFVPLASAVLEPRLAAPLLVLADNATAFPLVPAAWRAAARREVACLTAGALLGTPVGAWLLLRMDPVAMLALLASGWRYHGRPALPLSLAVGAGSGFFSGLAQMGGPPVVAYWLGGAIPAAKVRANIVLFFATSGVVSMMVYLFAGLLTGQVLVLAALMAPGYALGCGAAAACSAGRARPCSGGSASS